MGVGFLAIGCRLWVAGYLDDQLFRLNLNARDPGSNEAAVVNRPGRFEVLPNRFMNRASTSVPAPGALFQHVRPCPGGGQRTDSIGI